MTPMTSSAEEAIQQIIIAYMKNVSSIWSHQIKLLF